MNLDEMFPAKYLRGQDLAGPILSIVTSIGKEKMRAGPGKPEELKWVIRFELAKGLPPLRITQHPPEGYGLPMRKTLAEDIGAALKERDAEKWIGQKVVIFAAKEEAAGREVITTHARAPKAALSPAGAQKDAPPAEHQPDTAKENA